MLRTSRASRLIRLLVGLPWWFACSPATPDYLPLAPGHWGYFQVDTNIRGEPHQQRLMVANLRTTGNTTLQQAGGTRRTLLRTATGISLASSDPASVPILLLPRRLALGTRWPIQSTLQLVESRTFAAEDKLIGKRLPVQLTATVVGLEDVVVSPAGVFEHCLHLKLTGKTSVRADRGHAIADVDVAHEEWYAPDVGLVRINRTESSTSSFLVTGSYLQTLLEFND